MIFKRLALVALAAVSMDISAYSAKTKELPDWQNPQVVQRNRLPMSSYFETDGLKLSLSGTWDFRWYETIDSRSRDFYALSYDASDWDTMPVPGMWELNGYGHPVYKNVGWAWSGHYQNNPPFPSDWHNYAGQYRRTFTIDEKWTGKDIFLHIGSATSNVRVWVNGKEVGYSEDSKLEARFDITRYVKTGENLIALEIFRWCDGTYLEDQDFWRLTGLARDVYVYSREKNRIEDVKVNASASGEAVVKVEVSRPVTSVAVELFDSFGNKVAVENESKAPKMERSERGNNMLTYSFFQRHRLVHHAGVVAAHAEGGDDVVHALDGLHGIVNLANHQILALPLDHVTAELSDDGKLFKVGIVQNDLVDAQLLIPLEQAVDKDDGTHTRAADHSDFHMYVSSIMNSKSNSVG